MTPSNSQARILLPSGTTAVVRSISLTQPLRWLALGWSDMWRSGWVSFLHGVLMAAGGIGLWLVAEQRFWFLAGAFTGFLLVAPILATGLYALSRALERDKPTNMALLLQTWTNYQGGVRQPWGQRHWSLLQFGVLLALAGTGWVLTSAALIWLMSATPINTLADFVQHVVLAPSGFLFELWLALGGVLVAPIFASTVTTVPLLLDRNISLKEAVLTSWMVVLANPLALALWGGIIMLLTLLGFATAMLGLVLVVPLLGHASWHAYRDLLKVSGASGRE